MNVKFGRKYELTIYPSQFMQTAVPGNTFVDSLKTQVSQLSTLLNEIQSLSGLNVSTVTTLLNNIQSASNSINSLAQSLQSVLGIPVSIINGLESQITQQVANLISSIEGATVIPISFLNNFKNNALNQLSSLTAYLPQIPSPFTSFTSFGDTSSPIVIKNPFTLTFNIKRAALASANTGTFQIYNLNQTTRNILYKDKTGLGPHRRMTLRAGYFEPLPIIFDGNIKWCTSYRAQGQTNFITEIEAFDYSFAMKNAYTTKTFNGQVKKQDIINQLMKDIINASPSGQQISAGYIHQYPDIQYNRSLNGYSWPLLCDETQNTCHIDNGQLNVLSEDDCFTGSLTEINSSTGLLGSPKRSETWIEVEMLFEPTLVIGQQVNLDSQSGQLFNGVYKIVSINHFGVISDAVGGKCQTNVSLKNFRKVQQLIGSVTTL